MPLQITTSAGQVLRTDDPAAFSDPAAAESYWRALNPSERLAAGVTEVLELDTPPAPEPKKEAPAAKKTTATRKRRPAAKKTTAPPPAAAKTAAVKK